ncbi:DNA-3-methyladenine glycosylase [Longivirga aurantiaca]|uniref:Putative 3-methyladenine DNA glycosylase n=1 Tax=Longivirga aurantiaca TaxID=1837743 RepID=A0ABW1T2W6_9ACTN
MAGVLPRSFYARPADVVAPELLGCVVEAETAEGLVSVRLTEVEAYAGEDDAASHAWRGPTPRTEVMFGPPGHVYVYFTYGMHWCANLVCASDGVAAAVLLRAGEVVVGEPLARERRGAKPPGRRLASGPANLARALGLDGAWHGADVTRAAGRLRVRAGTPPLEVSAGPRVGITRAVDVPWRFTIPGEPTVSAPRP